MRKDDGQRQARVRCQLALAQRAHQRGHDEETGYFGLYILGLYGVICYPKDSLEGGQRDL